MREIFKRIKDFYLQKRKLAVGVSVAVLGLLAAVGAYAMIPDVEAAGTSMDSAILLSPSANPISVTPGNYYRITGSFSETYTLEYAGTAASDNVYLILDGVNFTLNSDKPAIKFTGQTNSNEDSSDQNTSGSSTYTSTSNYAANFVVYISGNNTITSNYAGATEPLISAESISYEVKSYCDDRWVDPAMNFKTASVTRNCNVRFEGTGNSSDVLKLVTAPESTGAAIGSGDVANLNNSIKLHAGNNQHSAVTIDGITYRWNQEVITGGMKYGSGDIEIANGANIIIEGNGNGAGIGTGASSTQTVSFKSSASLTAPIMQTRQAADLMDGDRVTISGGSLSIHMSSNALGSCIGTGAIAGVRENTGVATITGGNVDLVPSEEGYEFAKAVNGNGTQVFKFILDMTQAAGSDGRYSDGETYILEDTVGGEENYYARYSGSNATRNDYLNLTVDVLNAPDYVFRGYAAAYFNETGNDKMYFYLPTEVLPTHDLLVNGDLDSVTYQYKMGNDPYADISAGYAVKAKETKSISIKLNNVPAFCERVSYSTQGREGVIEKNNDGEYIFSFTMPDTDYSVYFSYEIGRYNINYDYGTASADVENPNSTTYACGETYTLQAPEWAGHTFEGWYSDAACTNKITSVTSDIVDETITVYAKWSCTVSFVDEEGTVIYEKVVDFGSRFTENDYPADPEETSLKRFEGWTVNGTDYEPGSHPEFEVTQDTVVTGRFSPVGYFVNINATYTYEDGYTRIDDLKKMSDFEMYFRGEPIAFTDTPAGEEMYYTTVNFADRSDVTTGKITAKNGYRIASIDVRDAQGNEIQLFSTIDDDHAFTFTMPDKDVYITVDFQAPDYTISYYDYNEETETFVAVTPVETEENPNRYEFNAMTETFSLNPAPETDKYRKFAGWYVFGDQDKTIVDTIPTGAYSSDVILIAAWEDVVTYPVEIAEDCAEYVKVYDSDGNEVSKGIPGESLSIVVEPGMGIRYESVTYFYTDEDGGVYTNTKTPSEDQAYPCTYTFKMPEYKVDITGEFSLITYNITYLNLFGAVNVNPVTYTVKSVIELEAPEKEGRVFEGWKIVVPDPENGYYAVKEEDISTIKDMTGNLILIAEWDKDDYEDGVALHRITVDNTSPYGNIVSYAEEAYSGQYVFISVTAERGYRLKSISYDSEEPVMYSAVKALRAVEDLFNVSIDIPLYEVAEGVYYFIMPDNDVKLTAEFEPIEYSITYIDGNAEDNPAVYTVESVIELTAPSKDGYEFLGWYDDEDHLVSSIRDSIGNLTLTAKWRNPADINNDPDDPASEPEQPTDGGGSDSPDNGQQIDHSKDQSSNSVVDQLLALINDKSKVNSSEDLSARNEDKKNIQQQLSTGDKTNISHLILLCVISLIVIIIACPKKKENETNE